MEVGGMRQNTRSIKNHGTRLILATGALLLLVSFPAWAQVGYWHTSRNQILDANNKPVRIAGINWYGFETTDEVAHGLWAQDYRTILSTIRALGYNVIRIPFSNQMVETPIVPSNISFYGAGGPINGPLHGLNSLQILDQILGYAGSIGLHVILDNHRSEAGDSAEANGLWYTASYPETAWINDWTALARRYANDPTVIGFDLRNEPHNANAGGSCWDCGTTAHDWHRAAERAGNAVLAVNPHLLIAVEGTDCYNGDCGWWGGNLEGAAHSPVVLNVANQLIYSAHDYGPNLYRQRWFNGSTTAPSLIAVWTKFWAYLSLNGVAPVWLGEFGTTNSSADLKSTVAGSQGQWFQNLVGFLHANSQLEWTYWALNGEDSYALLDSNYDGAPVSALKQQMLATIQMSGAATPTPTVTATPKRTATATPKRAATATPKRTATATPKRTATATPRPTATPVARISCHVSYTVYSDWGNGFNVGISVSNTGTSGIDRWKLSWTWAGNQTITSVWNATGVQNGKTVTLTNASYNPVIPAGGSQSGIGFNGSYGGANVSPTSFYLNATLCH
jgi:endoglucanase